MLEWQATMDNASPWPYVSWSLFILLLLALTSVMLGIPWGAGLGLVVIVGVLAVWQFPYAGFFIMLALAPLAGLLVSIPVTYLQIGQRALGGSIDISLGEIIAALVLVAWALRVLLTGVFSRERYSMPWLPAGVAYAGLAAASLMSLFSPALPDPWMVLKYTLRPVLFVYLFSVALPVNFLRTRQRLKQALLAVGAVGVFFALDGLRSLFFFSGDSSGVYRAHPLSFFGVIPLGGNHHALAELLVFAVPCLLALAALTRERKTRRIFWSLAGGMTFITLFTFARAAWLVAALQLVLLWATLWRGWFHRQRRLFASFAILLLPLVVYMAIFSISPIVKSSTDARSLLTDSAIYFWRSSPWVGVGAGTFVERISHVWAFAVEFGAPQDAHGLLQKIMSEMGVLGLLALTGVVVTAGRWLRHFWTRIHEEQARQAYTFLLVGAFGSWVYQFFSSSLWTARVWLPLGLALAAGRILAARQAERDPDFLTSYHV